MLAQKAPGPFDSREHLFEFKWDGTRCILRLQGGVLSLQNRRLRDITWRYPELRSLKGALKAPDVVLDGELVVLREGRPHFGSLQQREQAGPERAELLSRLLPATYMAFDLLCLRGRNLMGQPLGRRRELLAEGAEFSPEAGLLLSEGFVGRGRAVFRQALRLGFEGVVAKTLQSPYVPGERSPHWLKIKRQAELDAVVIGWLRHRRPISSLLLGLYDSQGRLRHIGQVGAGLSRQLQHMLYNELKALRLQRPQAADIRLPAGGRGRLFYTRPEVVVRVAYQEWTAQGRLRAPRLKAIRRDKPPEDCTFDQ